LTTYPHYKNYRTAAAICFSFVVIIVGLLIYLGKKDSFLLINGNHHSLLDVFFKYATYLGDGLIYVPILIYCIFWNRKFVVPVIAGIILCTLFAQGLKRFVFEEELRPISLEVEKIIIHKVEGETMRSRHSFPSGHTSTAFTMSLLLSSIIPRRVWSYVLPFIALLVGYSRVYLAQHFLTDVCAGVIIGIVSSYLALLIYHRYVLRKQARA
jgi:membrane-associated phospholipid phosphatase